MPTGPADPCASALTAVPFHTVPGLILARSCCIGSACVPLRSNGGKSVVLGPEIIAPRWSGIGDGWYGILFAAQSGRWGRGCWPGEGCDRLIDPARRDDRDDVVVVED